MPSRIRYDLANPTISIRVSRVQYEELNQLRINENLSFKDLLLEALEEPEESTQYHIGKCSICGKGFVWNITNANNKAWLDGLVNKAHPTHKKCQNQVTLK
jgi:hypothetical protein